MKGMEFSIENIDTSLLLASMGVFLAGLGVMLKGVARLLDTVQPLESKRGLFGKKK